ncbi:MAG: class I SAM-dependent methyltransferase [Anaerolineae bacterium]|nr:class I SAM-dependent methyltransferase [Anaerolineae bacterium]
MTHINHTSQFYDSVADDYHLFYRNWDAQLEREGLNLRRFFRDHNVQTVLDASCGPGTQAIALARLGYTVTAADPSAGILARARQNAAQYGVGDKITFVQSDFQNLHHMVEGPFDAILTKGNAIPH